MRRVSNALLVLGTLSLLGFTGCGDDDEKPKTDTRPPDMKVGDQSLTPDKKVTDTGAADKKAGEGTVASDTGVTGPHNIGETCATKTDCKSGSPDCIMYTNLFSWIKVGAGICSKACTADNTNTPLVDEDSCPKPGYKCATFGSGTSAYHYCLKTCSPSTTTNPCPAKSGTTCHPRSTQWGGLTTAVCIWPACTSNKDCPVNMNKSCTKDSDCTSFGTDAFCESSLQMCARPGKCTTGGICGTHTLGKSTAKIGDPCNDDRDCPSNGSCLTEGTSSSAVGVNNRNGYCTVAGCAFATSVTDYSCGTTADCNFLYYGGICFKTCDLTKATECRGYSKDNGGDYECYAWDNLSVSGKSVTSKPICQSAASITCDTFGTTGSLDCSSLGLTGNTTNMTCRDRDTGVKKSNKFDTNGVCLDDTASGTFKTATPDAGVPDKGAADKGAADKGAADAGTSVQ